MDIQTLNTRQFSPGKVVKLAHESKCLQGNRLNDPANRIVHVYLPPGYDDAESMRYPCIWHLAAYTNSGLGMENWRGFEETLPERLDRLIGSGKMGPAIVVAPDCFTRLGGNQYVDSDAVGPYLSYINDELVSYVDATFKTKAEAAHRAVLGKSSGGYGAMQFAMHRPGVWGAIGNQSGDAGFEWVYQPEFPTTASVLGRYQFDIARFVEVFWGSRSKGGGDFATLMVCCLAASYAPEPDSKLGFALPFDVHTLELDKARWARWLSMDPVRQVRDYADELKQLRAIYMDCGNRDQYNIHFGMRRLSRELNTLGVDHIHEEFDGTHSKIDHRLDRSLSYLYQHIS